MSGGHFDYQEYKISEIADEIQHLIDTNADDTKDEWGNPRGNHYPTEKLDWFKIAIKTLRQAFKMAHRIDYLVSGDDGEDTFLRLWTEEGLPDKNEIDFLRKCCTQRGTRMQIMRNLFSEADWERICQERPEMRYWFNKDGVSY